MRDLTSDYMYKKRAWFELPPSRNEKCNVRKQAWELFSNPEKLEEHRHDFYKVMARELLALLVRKGNDEWLLDEISRRNVLKNRDYVKVALQMIGASDPERLDLYVSLTNSMLAYKGCQKKSFVSIRFLKRNYWRVFKKFREETMSSITEYELYWYLKLLEVHNLIEERSTGTFYFQNDRNMRIN